ncbi:MAG: lycopene cyclase family protein, partial [Pseudomonadota bacterium]
MVWDYIICGAGSAGCVLANRLSADPTIKVLLLEAGGSDNTPLVRIPAAEIKAIMNSGLNWKYQSEPDPSL